MSQPNEFSLPVRLMLAIADGNHRVSRIGVSVTVVVLAALISSCAGMSSRQVADNEIGVTYYMPSRDILITLTVDKKGKRDIGIGLSEVYPDLSERYVLKFNRNWVGKNVLNLTVTEEGLLTTSKSTTTSNLSEALQNLAKSTAGLVEGFAIQSCTDPGSYVHRIDIKRRSNGNACDGFCGLECSVSHIGGKSQGDDAVTQQFRSGVYYRQARPYEIKVKDGNLETIGIASIPSKSGTKFLPITRSLFSGSSADIAFEKGMLTSIDQEADGEIVALLKLPADVIGAYFDAVGNLFEKKKTALANESLYLEQLRIIEASNKKTENCLAAMADEDDDAIEEFCQ